MKIGDRVFVHGFVDEIRKDTVIVKNNGGYFGTIPEEVIESGQDDCSICLRQGCAYRTGIVRVNCPLWRGSAV